MKPAILLFALLLSGCAALLQGEAPAGITQASADKVAKCKYLGPVAGHSMYLNLMGNPVANAAKRDAMLAAKDIGGTHVVWNKNGSTTSISGTDVRADAYACG